MCFLGACSLYTLVRVSPVNFEQARCGLDTSSKFIDVGSGLGKPNLHVAQDPGVALSYGVEMEEVRWQLSMHNLNETVKRATVVSTIPASAKRAATRTTRESEGRECLFLFFGRRFARSLVCARSLSRLCLSSLCEKDFFSLSKAQSPLCLTRVQVPLGNVCSLSQAKCDSVYFQHGDITQAATLDPFTHVYMFDVGFPPPLLMQIAQRFNQSRSAKYLISFQTPRRVIDDYGFQVEHVEKIANSMHGSSEARGVPQEN